ncbi:HCNGP-domain-containing protein [Peniophora sp. CONT]|nr:HCNGP-domain-containing protein [Peniophora sp. CONT]
MNGLVSYSDDSQSDNEIQHDVSLKRSPDQALEKAEGKNVNSKPQIIKRRAAPPKTTVRAHQPDERPAQHVGNAKSQPPRTASPSEPPQDELGEIRALLRPPDISGLPDWGIPPPSTAACDSGLEAKLAQFRSLKHDPVQPKHFNDALMASRAFRNPHLYAKLVEFVGADERATNIPPTVWNPADLRPEWYADQIADLQKKRNEERESAQSSSSNKRSKIDFTSSRQSGSSTTSTATASGSGNPYLQHHAGNPYASRQARGGETRKARLSEGVRGRWG